MAVQEKLLTAEEFAELPSDGKKYDLVKGVLVEVCRPKYAHGRIQAKLSHYLYDYLEQHQLGEVITESGHILARNPDTVRGPDVAFNSSARIANQDPAGYVTSGPDLAVEIVSTNDTAKVINDKIIEYFRAETRLMWVIYPDTKQVYVYDGSSINIKVVDINGTLDGGDVLPGFTLPLAELFRGLGD